MALTGFLNMPDISGESTAAEHEEEIDVWGVEWLIEQDTNQDRRRHRFRRRADMGPLIAHKYVDRASPYLAEAVSRGLSFDEVKFTARRTQSEGPQDYLVLTLTNCVVTSCGISHTDPTAADERIFERVEIDFEQISYAYTQYGHDGTELGTHETEMRS